jgi:hypothetical protein
MTDTDKQILAIRPVDHVTSIAKGVLGAVPFAGSFLAEIAGTLIPNQRIERLAMFAEALGEKLADVADATLRANLTDENFTDAVEESLRQAARSTSDQRRVYIASLLANGVKSDAIDFIETKHLLRLLGEINDIEVIWLRAHYGWAWGQHDEEFHKLHATTLEPVNANLESTQEQLDREAMQESYMLHLESLGLLRSRIKFDNKTKQPEFDKIQGFKKSGFEITRLGELLVRYIDMEPADSNA